jgi:hypothetical protein
MLVDDFLPTYDASDAVATVVHADVSRTWVDSIEVGRKRPLVGGLGASRLLPDIVSRMLHGELPQRPPQHLCLRDTTSISLDKGGWARLAERPQDEIALGLVGKFCRPVIEFASLSADRFRDFAEPGFATTICSLSVRPIDERRTLLSRVMRTATTDEHARRRGARDGRPRCARPDA